MIWHYLHADALVWIAVQKLPQTPPLSVVLSNADFCVSTVKDERSTFREPPCLRHT